MLVKVNLKVQNVKIKWFLKHELMLIMLFPNKLIVRFCNMGNGHFSYHLSES